MISLTNLFARGSVAPSGADSTPNSVGTGILHRRRHRTHRAVTLLEVLLAIGIGALVAAGAAWQMGERAADLKAKAAADQLSLVAQAAEAYIKNNYLTVSSQVAGSGTRGSIAINELVDKGYLPGIGYDTTPYAGNYEIWLRGTGSGAFQAMVVVTGGEDPGRRRLPEIAMQSKMNTGVVINDPYDDADPDRILGLFGGWSASVPDFRPAGDDPVWLATLLAVRDDLAGNDYLYRGAIPGRPDLNEMRTNVTMTAPDGERMGIQWEEPGADHKAIDLRLSEANDGSKTLLVLRGGNLDPSDNSMNYAGATETTGLLVQSPDGNSPISIEVKNDTSGDLNTGGSTLTINATIDVNTADAATHGYGANNPYNLYVNGKTNITGDTRIGGNINVDGDSNLGDGPEDTTTVTGIFNVFGDTTLNGGLTVTNNATFEQDVTIEGNLTLDQCLAMGGASVTSDYCLNVGTGGRPYAAQFADTVRIEGGAYAGNPDVALWADGDIIANSSNVRALAYYYQSDARYKDNISELDGSQLEQLLQIRGVSYNWKTDGRKDFGVIAQEVEKVYPELVHTDPKTGLKSVEYGNLIAPTIEAVRELKSENDALKAKVDALLKDGKK